MNQWFHPQPCKCNYRKALDKSHCCTRFSLLRCLFNWKQIFHWILPMFSCGSLHLFSSIVWWSLTNAFGIILLTFFWPVWFYHNYSGHWASAFSSSRQCQLYAPSYIMSLTLDLLIGHSCLFCATFTAAHLAGRQ